jgi:hypothetical protein
MTKEVDDTVSAARLLLDAVDGEDTEGWQSLRHERVGASSVIVALDDERRRLAELNAELVALLTDTTVRGGSCDGVDSEEDGSFVSADDPMYHDCTDVDEHQKSPCWAHMVRALLARIEADAKGEP